MAQEPRVGRMEYDRDKVDALILALLWLTSFKNADGTSLEGPKTMDRLYSKGYLSDPKNKTKSIVLSEEGEKRSRDLFAKHFSLKH
jgi:hypothetical protein